MSDKISVILELTQHEAAVLYYLTLKGVDWNRSGEFGAAAEEIYYALSGVIDHNDHRYASDQRAFTYHVWEKRS